MYLTCIRCNAPFDHDIFIGYCDDCKSAIHINRERIHEAQQPMPGVLCDGKFSDERICPESVYDPVNNKNVCGMCGCDDIEPGYGIGGGYGIGVYNFCMGCGTFLDFSEDKDE
jgi:hypothetical protein